MKRQSKLYRLFGLLFAFVLIITACVAPGGAAQPAASGGEAAAPAKTSGFVIGVSNTLVGNGWRGGPLMA